MSNVVPITRQFDRDVDTVLSWMHEPETAPIPMVVVHAARQAETVVLPALGALLPGPATELDAVPLPVQTVKCQRSIGWAFVIGFTLGCAWMAGMMWLI